MAFIDFTNDTALYIASGSCSGLILFIAICSIYKAVTRR